VGGEQDRLALVAQATDQLPGPPAGLGVEAGGRLVEVDQLRVADHAEGEIEPAALAARERDDSGVELVGQAGERDHLVGRPPARVGGSVEVDRLADREVGLDAALLEDDPDPVAEPGLVVLGVCAEHRDLAGAAGPVALEDLDDGRLACAIGAEQSEDGAPRDLEIDPFNRLVAVVGLAQPANPDHQVLPHRRRC
jgi:hypothetical protein